MRASYPTYKSTSIPWLPEIPEHWDLIGLNLLFRDNKNKNKGMVESLILSLSYGNIIRKQKEENYGLIPESFETYQIVEPGYIVLRLTDLQNDKRSLRVGYVKEKGIITSAYTGLIPNRADSRYYYYLLHYLDIRKHFYSLGGGVRQSSDYNEIKKTKVPLPPLPEQTVIASYLDAKTEQINRFIEKKEKLIRSLREKIDVIVQSVEGEPLNESKFWPTIPQTWRIEKAKRIFSEIKIKNQPTEPLLAATQDRGVLPKDLCTENFVSPSGDLSGLKLVCEDDYVISLRSFQGGIEYSPYRGIISPAYTIIRLKEDYNNPLLIQYYKYLFKTPQFISLLNTAITGIRDGKNVNWVDFAELPLPIPSVEHLKLMVEDFNRYEKLVIVFEKEKRKLEEFKNSLIAEVVTGKIKVA